MTSTTRTILAVVLIGIGSLWLLGALGLVSPSVLNALLAYWPLLLVGLGLDLLWRRRVLGLPFTVLALAVIAVLALVPGVGRANEQRFSEALGVAREAEVALHLSDLPTKVGALEGGDTLFDARLQDARDIRFEVAGSERKRIVLERRSGSPFGFARQGSWDISLSPAVPLELTVDGGSGQATLDLSGLDLRRLALETGSGSTRLTLSAHDPRSEVQLRTGSGRTEVSVPEGADVSMVADTGSGATAMRVGPGGYLTLELSSGSGSVEIDVPDDANVRLEVEDDGSGRLDLPGFLRRASGDGDEGVWQTEGFAPGAGQVIIAVRDAGSGSLRLY